MTTEYKYLGGVATADTLQYLLIHLLDYNHLRQAVGNQDIITIIIRYH